MDMPKPTDGHRRLEKLAGNWEGEETIHPSSWEPQGAAATARYTGRMDLNGFGLIGDYEHIRGGVVTFSGHYVYTYNPKDDLVILHWFDCMGSPAEVFTGGWKGDVLTMSHGGPGPHMRMTYDLTEPGTQVTRGEMSEDGGTWKTLFEGRHQRV